MNRKLAELVNYNRIYNSKIYSGKNAIYSEMRFNVLQLE